MPSKTYLSAGYKREYVQTGSRVRVILPSPDVTMTSDNPSDLVCVSMWMVRELRPSRSQVDEAWVKVSGRGNNDSRTETHHIRLTRSVGSLPQTRFNKPEMKERNERLAHKRSVLI
jgi:hypothetical protein